MSSMFFSGGGGPGGDWMGDSQELPHRLEGVVELVDRGDALDLLRLGHVRVQLARALPEGLCLAARSV